MASGDRAGGPGVEAIARGGSVGRMSCKEPILVGKDKRDPLLGLPPANTKRWVSRRKAAVVLATRSGVISCEEACERYALSHEELTAWEAAFDQDGVRGLRITRLQNYRRRGR